MKKIKVRETAEITRGYVFTDYIVEAESYEEAIKIIDGRYDNDSFGEKIIQEDYDEYIRESEFMEYSFEGIIEDE